jgi:putative DNA primase/helicase
MIVTNELPRFDDVSGALPSRFLPLVFGVSWLGREDVHLTADLLAVLPGILNWALDGMDRVRANGRFTATAAAAETVKSLERLTSPVLAFVADCCEVSPALWAQPAQVYQAWREWCARQGREHPGTAELLGRDLHAALPGLTVIRPRGADGKQVRWYQGIALKMEPDS